MFLPKWKNNYRIHKVRFFYYFNEAVISNIVIFEQVYMVEFVFFYFVFIQKLSPETAC